MIDRLHSVSKHVVRFGHYLRSHGYLLSSQHLREALTALAHVPLNDAKTMQMVLQTSLCLCKAECDDFKSHYHHYWHEHQRGEDSKIKESAEESKKQALGKPTPLHELQKWLSGNHEKEEVAVEGYSTMSPLEEQDIVDLTESEILDLMDLLKRAIKKWDHRYSRRFKHSTSQRQVDVSKTIRQGFSRGGEIIEWKYKERKRRRYRLVVIADVSRSMSLYSRFVIHLVIALKHLFEDFEAYAFSTELQYIDTDLLQLDRDGDLRAFMHNLTLRSGGTRIGASLSSFVDQYAMGSLYRNTKVIIISDGWDLGDPEIIGESMYRIAHLAKQVIWLNPLKGRPGYEPTVRGMQAALPYVDHFLAANSLRSLEQFIPILFSNR
ncbi:MAG: VWA domain-containing protein [Saprospiraceae bacterium]|nr:VWA domain-containing protein [Saprospiraceae bacterium]